MDKSEKAVMASSLRTRISLEMAAIERPAPPERRAILEVRDWPGRESMMLLAVFLGSVEGTLLSWRRAVREVEIAGTVVRAGIEGRSLAAPGAG